MSVCLGLLLAALSLQDASSTADEAKATLLASLRDHEPYAEDAAYVQGLLEEAHEDAFEMTYSRGGRRRAPSFSKRQYRTLALRGMSQRAERDGRTRIALWLADPTPSGHALADLRASLGGRDLYMENIDYVDGLLERSHEAAFVEAFEAESYQGRSLAPRFNAGRYRELAQRAMSQRARADGRERLARFLEDPAEYERLWLNGEID